MVTEISTWQEFDAMRNNPSADYKLVNDLTDTMADYESVAGSWDTFDFSGTFDGQDYTVGPMEGTSYGVFSNVTGTDTEVKNVTFDVSLSGSNQKTGFARQIYNGAVIDNVTITGGITSTGSSAYGLAEDIYNNSTVIKNCTIDASINGSGNRASGICYDAYDSTSIENCEIAGQLTSSDDAAGVTIILRQNSEVRGTTVSNTVQSSNNNAAGIVKDCRNSTVKNCTVTGDVLTSTNNGNSVAGIAYEVDVDNQDVDLGNNTVDCTFSARNESSGILNNLASTSSTYSLFISNNDITASFTIQEGGANGILRMDSNHSLDHLEVNNNDVTMKGSDTDYQNNFCGVTDRFQMDQLSRLEIEDNTITWDFNNGYIDSIGDVYGVCREIGESSSSNIDLYVRNNYIEFKQAVGGRDHLSVFGRLEAYSSKTYRVTDNYAKFKDINGSQQDNVLFIKADGHNGNPQFNIKRNGVVADRIEGGVESFFSFQDNSNEQWEVRENFCITTEEYRQHDNSTPFSGLYGRVDSNVDVRHGYSFHQSILGEATDYNDGYEGLSSNFNGTIRYHYSIAGKIDLDYDSTNSEQILAHGVSENTSNSNAYNNDSNIYPLTNDEDSGSVGHHAALPGFLGNARDYQLDGSNVFDNNFDTNEWVMVQEGVPINGYMPLSDGPPILKNADIEFQLEAFSNVKLLDFDYAPADTLTGSVSFDGVGVENSTVYAIESANDRLIGPKQTDANGDVSFDVDGSNNVIYLLSDFEDSGDRFGRVKSINFDSS